MQMLIASTKVCGRQSHCVAWFAKLPWPRASLPDVILTDDARWLSLLFRTDLN